MPAHLLLERRKAACGLTRRWVESLISRALPHGAGQHEHTAILAVGVCPLLQKSRQLSIVVGVGRTLLKGSRAGQRPIPAGHPLKDLSANHGLRTGNVSMKDEKIIFHNINSKAVPIRSERLLEGIIVDSKDELSFSDKELDDSFGHEYLLARKVLKNKPLAIRKLKAIPWIRSDLITALIDIIESIQKRFGNIQTAEHEEAFGIALSNALNDAKLGENGTLLISSGLLFLLVALYYNIEISSPSADAVQYKDRLLTWSEKYQITDAQIDTEQNAASNAECIEAIFNRYVRSTEQTIFMSRCFSAEYNETENAIRRAINEINNEKKTGIMLIRVDEHHEGTTGQISDRIFRDIESAGLVIADLSSGKLNVPHEIGYAMGLKKDLILVHNGTSEEAEKHIPSNIRMFEQIRFNGDYQTLQNEIKRRLIDYYKL